jgi:glycosyltransferase involved in cell wall biosynthesis
MKVLIVTEQMYLGGLETHIVTLCRGLIRQGLNIFFYYEKGLTIWRHKLEKMGVKLLESLMDLPLVDLIHLHVWGDSYQKVLGYATRKKIPLVATYHGLYRQGLEELLPVAKIICVSDKVRNFLEVDAVVIENGVDLDWFRAAPLPFGKKVAWVGRSDGNRWVGLKALFRACRALNLECHVAGGFLNPYGVEILTEFSEIYWHGPILDMAGFLKKIDVVLTTSRGIREAMTSGRVAVVMNGVWYSGVVTPENVENLRQDSFMGWEKRPAFSETIRKDLECLYHNPKRMADLGDWGSNYGKKHFSSEVMIAKIKAVYAFYS